MIHGWFADALYLAFGSLIGAWIRHKIGWKNAARKLAHVHGVLEYALHGLVKMNKFTFHLHEALADENIRENTRELAREAKAVAEQLSQVNLISNTVKELEKEIPR